MYSKISHWSLSVRTPLRGEERVKWEDAMGGRGAEGENIIRSKFETVNQMNIITDFISQFHYLVIHRSK